MKPRTFYDKIWADHLVDEQPDGTALLAGLTSLPAVVAAALLAGAVRGMLTLLTATAVPDRWGAGHYGRLTGLVSAPVAVTAALSPWAGAAIAAAVHGYTGMVWVMAGLAAAAAVTGLASVPRHVDGDWAADAPAAKMQSRSRLLG